MDASVEDAQVDVDGSSGSSGEPDAGSEAGGSGGESSTDGGPDSAVADDPTGSECTSAGECAGGVCLNELIVVGVSWELPGGYCSRPCELFEDCQQGIESCYQQVDDDAVDIGGACVKSCDAPEDCREGYTCTNEQCLPVTPVGAANGEWGRTWSGATAAQGAAVDSGGNAYFGVATIFGTNLGGGPNTVGGWRFTSFTGAGAYRWENPDPDGPPVMMTGGVAGYYFTGGQGEVTVESRDAAGVAVWSRAFPAGVNGGGADIAVSADGNIAVAGGANDELDLNGEIYVGSGSDDGAVVLLDTDGEPVWGALFGEAFARATRVAFAPNGDVWTTGRAQPFSFGGESLAGAGGSDVFLTRHAAADGTPVDGISFGSAGTDQGSGIAVDGAGNVFVAGNYGDAMQVGTEVLPAHEPSGIFVASFADDGSFRWAKAFGGPTGGRSVFAARITPDGSLRIAGDFSGTLDVEGTMRTSAGSTDIYLVEFDADGTVTGVDAWGAPVVGQATGEDHLLGFAVDATGANVFSGQHDGPINFGTGELLVGGAFIARVR